MAPADRQLRAEHRNGSPRKDRLIKYIFSPKSHTAAIGITGAEPISGRSPFSGSTAFMNRVLPLTSPRDASGPRLRVEGDPKRSRVGMVAALFKLLSGARDELRGARVWVILLGTSIPSIPSGTTWAHSAPQPGWFTQGKKDTQDEACIISCTWIWGRWKSGGYFGGKKEKKKRKKKKKKCLLF